MPEKVEHEGGFQARVLGEGQRLSGGNQVDRAQQLVDRLEPLAVAGTLTHMVRCAKRGEDRGGLVVCRPLASAEEQELSRFGTADAAGDRAVQDHRTVILESFRGASDWIGSVGPRQEPDLAGGDVPFDGIQQLAQVIGGGHHDQDGSTLPQACGGIGGGDTVFLGKGTPDRVDIDTQDRDLLGQATGHGQAHGSQAHDPDLGGRWRVGAHAALSHEPG